MHTYRSPMPWMPRIGDFTEIPNMGVLSLSCITGIERMQGWKDGCQKRLRERAHHRWASIRTAGGRTVEACMKLQSPLDVGIRHKQVKREA
jgi:hypothetical protein